jgi:NAD+ kinase
VPVLGVACGSLGALTSVKASELGEQLKRVAAGEAQPRALPALSVTRDGEPLGDAFNDLVVVRGGAGQVILDIDSDGGPFVRMAGDGVVVATPLGSSAYTLAAGGPLIAAGDDLVAVTPLAPHAGSIPSAVFGRGRP